MQCNSKALQSMGRFNFLSNVRRGADDIPTRPPHTEVPGPGGRAPHGVSGGGSGGGGGGGTHNPTFTDPPKGHGSNVNTFNISGGKASTGSGSLAKRYGPVGLVGAGLGGLALAGYGPSHFFGDLGNKLGNGLGDAAGIFTHGLAEVGHTLGNFMGDLGNFGSSAAQGIGGTMRNVTYMLTAGVIVGGVLYVRNQSK